MVSGMLFRVVVTARRVEGEPWAQIRRSAAVYEVSRISIMEDNMRR
jgi:predicted SPOUT superfamily RNA methylase MTH1